MTLNGSMYSLLPWRSITFDKAPTVGAHHSRDPLRTVVGWDIRGGKSPILLKWITQSFDAHISEK
jgi:hypothetical protein